MEIEISGDPDKMKLYEEMAKTVDEMYARDIRPDPGTHVRNLRGRFERAGQEDHVKSGTEEHAQLAARQTLPNGVKPNSVKEAVEAIENRQSAELQTSQHQSGAAEPIKLNGVEPGSVMKAVSTIENNQLSRARQVQLDYRDRSTVGRG